MVSHWVRYDTGEPFVPNLDKFGFIYIITNTQTTKAYVGCKQYFTGKKKIHSKWEKYTGSSKYLNEDIKKIGKKHFTFEVIAEYKNKRSLRYYEMYYQVKWNVLTATIEGSDEPAFYNSYVGGKFYPPIELYSSPSWLQNKYKFKSGEDHILSLGKHRITFNDGRIIIVDNLGEFAKDNNYNKSTLFYLRQGFRHYNIGDRYKGKILTEEKDIKISKHKDIVKVELLGKEETNVTKESNV
tara:strand:+ start:6661 stop:7380 length:720 start_codon:yes stop_codon:yes gene_type:complete